MMELNRYYENGNLPDYSIKVHALKGSARIIGATAFGERAQEMENAAKNGDRSWLEQNHEAFLAEFEAFRPILSKIFTEKQEKEAGEESLDFRPVADDETMEKAFGDLKRGAEDMDIDQLEAVFETMKDYEIPEEKAALWKKLHTAYSQFDYEGIASLLAD